VILKNYLINLINLGVLMKRISSAILVASSLIVTASIANADQFIRMVSGPSGGSWYPLGAKVMQTIESNIKGVSTSNTSGGGISNVMSVDGGDAEIGWTYAHTVANGYSGKGKFKKAHKNVRYFATLYPAAFQVAVRADSKIKSFEDMKSANISPGKPKWTGTAFCESIIKDYGYDFSTIKKNGGVVHMVSYKESVALMKDGQADVFMAATSVPQASFIELENSPGIRFIGLPKDRIDRIVKNNPGYIYGKIPASAYKSLDKDIPTLGIVTSMIVHKDLSDDLVYKMTKVFWDNHAEFVKVKGVWKKVLMKDAVNGAAVPIHPGAAKYYKEQGVM
jgi:TRAP transporter TAXI family solute receptor